MRACIKLWSMRSAIPRITNWVMSLVCLLACSFAQAQSAPPEEQPALPKPKASAPRTAPEAQPRLKNVQAPAVTQEAPVKSDPRYRVELLVFRHLDGTEEGSPEAVLRDFSAALDLLTPPEAITEGDPTDKAVEPSVPHATETSPGVAAIVEGEEALTEEEPPVELVEAQSEAMQHAWRRFRASAGFRPEQFLAWEQSMATPFPTIRVHDLEVLKEIDAVTGLPMGEEIPDAPVEFNDTTRKPDETAAAGEKGAEDVLPPPNIRFYRIDGTSRLSRTRFLHLDIDLEWREPLAGGVPVPNPSSESVVETTPVTDDSIAPGDITEDAWVVHKLSQSRQVRTNKYEYFDGPTFAVLAMITRIDPLTAEEQQEEEALNNETEDTQSGPREAD